MAGVKGRSGGPRPNSGGKREGAGKKPAPAAKGIVEPPVPGLTRDPLEFLLDVMQGKVEANAGQIKAAQAAAQYLHAKKEGGKKDERADKAKSAGAGKFAPSAPPLRVVGK